MDTPVPPDRDGVHAIYGGFSASINRRKLLAGAGMLGLAGCARGGGDIVVSNGAGFDMLARAVAWRGGAARIARVTAVGWTGTATVVAGERTLVLGIDTRVEPFGTARSTSWILAEGRAKSRTLVIEPAAGYVLRDGARTDLPERMVRHERQQYGLYGYMLFAAQCRNFEGEIQAIRPGFPGIGMVADRSGALTSARYTVASPTDDTTILQRFVFAGRVEDRGIAWPERMTIEQNGKPYFTLVIDRLSVETRA